MTESEIGHIGDIDTVISQYQNPEEPAEGASAELNNHRYLRFC